MKTHGVAMILLIAVSLTSCSRKSSEIKQVSQTAPISQQQKPTAEVVPKQQKETTSDYLPGMRLYFLAATPTDDWAYPVTLYEAQDSKLRQVRQISPQEEGVRSIRSWGNVIFLTHSNMLTVLHTDDPLRVDDVTPQPPLGFGAFAVIAEPKSAEFDELMMSSRGEMTPANIKWLSVASEPSTTGPRVREGAWNEYAAMRFEGNRLGRDWAGLYGAVEGDHLVCLAFDHHVVMDSLPAFVGEAINQTAMQRIIIVAASEQYLLFELEYSQEERFSKKLSAATETTLFLHDRLNDRWKTIQVEGNRSTKRLFGSWLASSVEMLNPTGKASPGRENERGVEEFGDYEIAGSKGNPGNARFPLIRGQFFTSDVFSPGVLVLQNLDDGRKIRIETGQEDSEILSVRETVVVYRVNDAVYQAMIAGDRLEGTTLLAKDEDVPEVHWVFWGPQVGPVK
jgi:hypothetical protein